MQQDRRRSQRHALRGLAKIRTSASTFPRDCWVTDVSDGGVRLFVEGLEVPESFTLVFDGDARPRECRVVWRLGHEIGAEFTDGRRHNFAGDLVRAQRKK
ncbi:MAG: PilZ domain-containing protein [Bradyrhizobiaceae bacterium]|nr:MAG: PilZ domain-containing protein [Bradyrhizobiaceae bacterium]